MTNEIMTIKEARNTINSLKQYYNDKNEDSYVGFDDKDNEALDMAIKALEQTRWIPVSERLPREDEEYHTFLVTDSKGRIELSKFYLSISDKKPYWGIMMNVVAWMPLPQSYTESEE